MKAFFIRWIVTTIAMLVASHVVPGIRYDSMGALLVAALLLGFVNAFIKPILMLLSLPFLILTLGLFTLVINSLVLWTVGQVVYGFSVADFWSAFWGSLVISVVSLALKIFEKRVSPVRVVAHTPRPAKPTEGRGRVIDV